MFDKNDPEIKALHRKRDSLRTKIKEWCDRGKNAIELVKEYHKLTELLQSKGCNVSAQAEYLQLDFWKNKNIESKPIKINKQPKQDESIKSNILEPVAPKEARNNIYILNLAWTEVPGSEIDFNTTINKISNYLHVLGLKEIDTDYNEVSGRTEKIAKYEFEGNDQSFQIIKQSANYILDEFASTQYESFNIAIFGKKRPF